MIEPNEWIGDPTTGYQPDDPPQGEHYCNQCGQWDEDCQCAECSQCDRVTLLDEDGVCETCRASNEAASRQNYADFIREGLEVGQ